MAEVILSGGRSLRVVEARAAVDRWIRDGEPFTVQLLKANPSGFKRDPLVSGKKATVYPAHVQTVIE